MPSAIPNPFVTRLSPPPIPSVFAWARDYAGAHGPLIDLSQAVPGYPAHPEMLRLLEAHATERKVAFLSLDGRTRDRMSRVDAFNREDGPPIFFISLKAGGTGLNLTAADYVIHYDPWWNPAVEDQATDRTHRIGQTRAVIAYKLITRGTVEEKILALQQRKRELALGILGPGGGLSEGLTEKDIETLFAED